MRRRLWHRCCCSLRRRQTEGKIAGAGRQERSSRGDHGGNDAFSVARAAAVDKGVVLARGEKRRDGVQVCGESDDGFAKGEEQVVAIGFGAMPFKASVVMRGEGREVVEEVVGHWIFVASGGVDVHKRAS